MVTQRKRNLFEELKQGIEDINAYKAGEETMDKKPTYLPITAEMSDEEKDRRYRLNQGIASSALEGIYPSEETLAELELLASGKITPDEYLAHLHAKYSKYRDAGEKA